MAKKQFLLPSIILTSGWGGDGSDTGQGSGGTTGNDDIMVCFYNEWEEMYGGDYDLDGDIDFDDYRTWWNENGLSAEAWNEYNPGVPLNPDPLPDPLPDP